MSDYVGRADVFIFETVLLFAVKKRNVEVPERCQECDKKGIWWVDLWMESINWILFGSTENNLNQIETIFRLSSILLTYVVLRKKVHISSNIVEIRIFKINEVKIYEFYSLFLKFLKA